MHAIGRGVGWFKARGGVVQARGPPGRTSRRPGHALSGRVSLPLQVAVVELPFGFVSSDEIGGAGGTCVIRGCVPKKLLVYACVRRRVAGVWL